jgi:peptidoglycan hydrolase-like protein with peptidoglycan-binding domain
MGMTITGPLNNPLIQTTTVSTISQTALSTTAPTVNTPPPEQNSELLVTNNTALYASTDFDPLEFNAPIEPAPQVLAAIDDLNEIAPLLHQQESNDPSLLPVIPPQQKARLDSVAQGLGFRDFRMLQYQMRNLPPQKVQAMLDEVKTELLNLPKSNNGKEIPETQLKQIFAQTLEKNLRAEIGSLFESKAFPCPQFNDQGGHWDTASLAAVFNALHEINQQSPEKFAVIARSPGNDKNGDLRPMAFNRSGAPSVSHPDNFLETMNEAMFLSRADQSEGSITLSETAVLESQNTVVAQIASKVDLLSRSVEGNVIPIYTETELQERGMDTNDVNQLKSILLNDYAQRYGGIEKLQEAINFIIRYRALDLPENVAEGKLPFGPIAVNGDVNDPGLQTVLARFGPNLMRQVAMRMEQTDAVSQMQTFMRENSAYGSRTELATDGLYGAQTKKAVRQFQMTLALNTLKERLEDDKKLPPEQRMEALHFFEEQFKRLEANPNQYSQILRDVTSHVQTYLEDPAQVSTETIGPLSEDLKVIGGMANGVFGRETANYLVGSWFNVMDSGSNLDMAEQLVSHEVSHLWEHQLDKENNLQVLENWGAFFNEGQNAQEDFGVGHMSSNDTQDHLHNDRTAASDYGSISPSEDFAESSRVFTYEPERLLRRSMLKFLVMNSLNGNPYSSSQILTMAKENGYTNEQVKESLNRVLGYGDQPIRFSPNLATRLDRDYATLRSKVENPDTTSALAGNTTAQIDTSSPESVALPRIDPSESGWAIDFLQEKYNSVLAQLNAPGLSTEQRQALSQEVSQFEEAFLNGGLEALQDNQIPDQAVTALNNHLTLLDYTGDKTIQGRAVVLALAKLRAQGYFNSATETMIQDYLPKGFQGMLQDPEYLRSLTYGQLDGRSVSPTSVLTHALTQSRQLEEKSDWALSQLGSASRWLNSAIAVTTSMITDIAGDAETGLSQREAQIQKIQDNPQFKQAWQVVSTSIQIYSQAMGIPMESLTEAEFARYILEHAGQGTNSSSLQAVLRNLIMGNT